MDAVPGGTNASDVVFMYNSNIFKELPSYVSGKTLFYSEINSESGFDYVNLCNSSVGRFLGINNVFECVSLQQNSTFNSNDTNLAHLFYLSYDSPEYISIAQQM